jgi:hypothetical protein
MDKQQQELLERFKELARNKVFIRTIYTSISSSDTIETTHRLLIATPNGDMCFVRVSFWHDSNAVLVNREISLIEHEICSDEFLWRILKQHAENSYVTSEDPMFVQMDVLSCTHLARHRTILNLLVDLIVVCNLLAKREDELPNSYNAYVYRLFRGRLHGFVEEKLRQLNASIKCLTDMSVTANQV